MKIAVIRSYDKDDMSAHLCYLTMKKYGIADKYIFFHDETKTFNHPCISSTGEDIYYHEPCGNYGGLGYVKIMLKELKSKLPAFKHDDYIIMVDSDVIWFGNPFQFITETIDHAGLYGLAKVILDIPHVSGQMNIIKGWLWNDWISSPENANNCWEYQVQYKSKAGTADDTLFSIYAYRKLAAQYTFAETKCWIHPIKIANKKEYDQYYKKYV